MTVVVVNFPSSFIVEFQCYRRWVFIGQKLQDFINKLLFWPNRCFVVVVFDLYLDNFCSLIKSLVIDLQILSRMLEIAVRFGILCHIGSRLTSVNYNYLPNAFILWPKLKINIKQELLTIIDLKILLKFIIRLKKL